MAPARGEDRHFARESRSSYLAAIALTLIVLGALVGVALSGRPEPKPIETGSATSGQGGTTVSSTSSATTSIAATTSTASCCVDRLSRLESVSLEPTQPIVAVGSSIALIAKPQWDAAFSPTQIQPLVWSTDQPSVATVDQSGSVRGIAPGRASITVAATNRYDARNVVQTSVVVTVFAVPPPTTVLRPTTVPTATTSRAPTVFSMTVSIYVEYPVRSCSPTVDSPESCADTDIVPAFATAPNPAIPAVPAGSRYVRAWLTYTNTSETKFCPRDIWVEVYGAWTIEGDIRGPGPFGAWTQRNFSRLDNRTLIEPCWKPGESRTVTNQHLRSVPGTSRIVVKYTPSETDSSTLMTLPAMNF